MKFTLANTKWLLFGFAIVAPVQTTGSLRNCERTVHCTVRRKYLCNLSPECVQVRFLCEPLFLVQAKEKRREEKRGSRAGALSQSLPKGELIPKFGVLSWLGRKVSQQKPYLYLLDFDTPLKLISSLLKFDIWAANKQRRNRTALEEREDLNLLRRLRTSLKWAFEMHLTKPNATMEPFQSDLL